MTVSFYYADRVCTLPGAVKEKLKEADAERCKVLLCLALHPEYQNDVQSHLEEAAAASGLTAEQIAGGIDYWVSQGILREDKTPHSRPEDTHAAQTKDAAKSAAPGGAERGKAAAAQKKKPHSELPGYADGEIAALMEEHVELRPLAEECQRLLGKILSSYELGILVGLYDALSLSPAYILSLAAYCQKRGKTSMRYIERTALGLIDEGIDTVEALEQRIAEWDRTHDLTYRVRRLFGLGERALTAKEKKYVETWANEWGIPFEMIEYAYELTVNYTSKASIPYAATIMKSWRDAGITTVEQARAAEEKFQQQSKNAAGSAAQSVPKKTPGKDKAPRRMGDFDVEEFLQLAMKRSFR